MSFLGTRFIVFVAVLFSLVIAVKSRSAFLSAMMNNMDTAKDTVNNFNKVISIRPFQCEINLSNH